MPEYVIKTGDRSTFIAGLRALADFMADNPDVLVPHHPSVGVCVKAADTDARRAGAASAAELLGVPLEDLGEGYYSARREFGPVTYYVAAVPPEERP
ncbi:hypothetical protein [Streptomyces malaysiensis]|uniref:hypothetical protein n=1 Tax=Streptomyces malaysiensis TaxID=92644 RepID=UPI0032202303|nr:hypothetical protein [Streptomyces malaysiensis]